MTLRIAGLAALFAVIVAGPRRSRRRGTDAGSLGRSGARRQRGGRHGRPAGRGRTRDPRRDRRQSGAREERGAGAPNYAQDTDVSPDGRTLYVSRGYLGDVAAFDLASGRLLWQRSLNTGRADHMTITPDGRSLFVSALMDNRVYKIATASGEIAGHMVTGVYPHDNKVSRDGQRLYNTSLGALASLPRPAGAPPLTETPGYPFQLTIADVETLTIRDRVKLDNAFRPWQFTPDEKRLYAQLSNQHGVVAYDLAGLKVLRRLDLPVKPGVTAADWDFEAPHHGLAITDDGRTLCLAGRASDYAALVARRI